MKRKESTGFLYEVGDERAESKTSQALREGLDVRAGNRKRKERERDDHDKDQYKRRIMEVPEETKNDSEDQLSPIVKEQPQTKNEDYPETWTAV